ncbi:synaptic vesicle membrane protein VAT-1 homolog [Schistocerca cancellata]|uniref:synaptic vesicle membrane protein VAT-1 homolog n=1 Tax=Schistocerca cancellata TaxID=274614 RepID=UPI0021191121|nr:synaptic vesicle membrane protein VAT-1 homolog [Schistocerca cancellata]
MAASPLQFQPPAVMQCTEPTRLVKSVILTGHGGIQKVDVEDTPIPLRLQEDHVEVEVHYCGMNFTDNYLRLGIIKSNSFPVIMGSECAGIVTRTGSEATEFKVGEKVLCLQMQGGLFREMVHVQKKYCFKIPGNINLCHAVCLGLNFLVAHMCLFEIGKLKTTQIVFMQSIGGGVGTAVLQLAQTVPRVRILGTASEVKHEQLRNLGANRTYSHSDNYAQRVLDLNPYGVDIVINSNGGSDIDKCVEMLKPCGKLINIGSNSSATYPGNSVWGLLRPSWDAKAFCSSDVIRRAYTMTGLNIGKLLETDREKMQSVLTEIFELRSQGTISPRAHNVLPFGRVQDAMTQLCTRENYGKVVLVIRNSAEVVLPTDLEEDA